MSATRSRGLKSRLFQTEWVDDDQYIQISGGFSLPSYAVLKDVLLSKSAGLSLVAREEKGPAEVYISFVAPGEKIHAINVSKLIPASMEEATRPKEWLNISLQGGQVSLDAVIRLAYLFQNQSIARKEFSQIFKDNFRPNEKTGTAANPGQRPILG